MASDAALQPLVDNHRTFLRFLERRVGSREEAEDILQDAFGRAAAATADGPEGAPNAPGFSSEESVIRWFYRVLRNAVIDHYRRKASASRALEAFANELDEAVPPPEVQDEICGCVRTLAQTLKPEYADALQRIDIEGVPVKAFAEAEGISASNAGVRIFRAREALRKQVVKSCGTCAEHGCLDCSCGKPKQTRSR